MQAGEQLEDTSPLGMEAGVRSRMGGSRMGGSRKCKEKQGDMGAKQCNVAVWHEKKHDTHFPETALPAQANKN